MVLVKISRSFIIVEIFGGSYYLLESMDLCDYKNKVPITSVLDCKEASNTIQHVSFSTEERNPKFPTGCYVYGKEVYFNIANSGSRHEGSRLICRDKG